VKPTKKNSHAKLTLDVALARIEESTYRLTRPRQVLLETILKQKKPFSAPDLEQLLQKVDGCDPVTIYRTLPVFIELGFIEKCDFNEDMTHYEVMHGERGHHHHHIVCTSCKKVEPLEFCIVDSNEQVFKRLGYRNLKHRLEFSGVCPACA
jgi:Fur family ferric uptake transcriptional regulator